MRSAGILMPITSLPSPYGVGTLGEACKNFIDFLEKAGQTYWQILPICPTGYGDSPYQSFSSFAGNPYMIDFDELEKDGLLQKSDYTDLNWGNNKKQVDYGLLYQQKYPVLRIATEHFTEQYQISYEHFCEKNAFWLNDYALFMSIKNHFGGVSWRQWPEEVRKREQESLDHLTQLLDIDITFWKKIQFLFFFQWDKIKTYAKEHQVLIIGDIPIYVSEDSCDVWSNPEQFQLDQNLCPIEIAGCPPDGFSADGQLWGNPLFDWEFMKEDGYQWWIRRIAYQKEIYDVIRIDHFRGFDEYYSIPYGDTTAHRGVWKQGPGIGLFRAIEEALGKLPIIAEDLGFLTDSVKELLTDSGFPGMKLIEFAFDSRDDGGKIYLPHNYPKNCVVYTGTHDNETICGWLHSITEEELAMAVAYMRLNEEEGYHWGIIKTAWASVADTAIIPMQDLLGLGNEARLNTPSTLGNNWAWRSLPNDFTDDLAEKIKKTIRLYGR